MGKLLITGVKVASLIGEVYLSRDLWLNFELMSFLVSLLKELGQYEVSDAQLNVPWFTDRRDVTRGH